MRLRHPSHGHDAAWLTATGSLSARLQRARPPLAVQRLHQGVTAATPHERAVLGQPRVHGRWVLLTGAGQPMVFARSAVRLSAAHGPWQAIRGLGTRPLADVLFSRADVRRSALAVTWLPPRHAEARQMAGVWQAAGEVPPRGVWRRHSVFWRADEPLIVSEYFAPQALQAWPAALGVGWHSHLVWQPRKSGP